MESNDKRIISQIWTDAQRRYNLKDEDRPRCRQKIRRTLEKRYNLKKNPKNGQYPFVPQEAVVCLIDWDEDLKKYLEKIAKKNIVEQDEEPVTEEDMVCKLSEQEDRFYPNDVKNYPQLKKLVQKYDPLYKLEDGESSADDSKRYLEIKKEKIENTKLKAKLENFDHFFDKHYVKPKKATVVENNKAIKKVINDFITLEEVEDTKKLFPVHYFDDVLRCIDKDLDFDWSTALEKYQAKNKNVEPFKFDWNSYIKDAIKKYFFVDYDIERPTDYEYFLKIEHPENYFILQDK
ncbi:hypothetical protein [Lactobacillus gasseri]|uniref:hypothetical protein n=1 Tax=Lactobacillus gasseri TaxID=1596 RepID=UPI001196F502|nr:hypothetical protein [Lactobacillus gasseri]TVU93489.1 hypothetical protein FOF75_02525 [Lactobacillus gasseri]TVV14782.1 hypothetical protein FOF66_07120 [Lactobacillus gasseri]